MAVASLLWCLTLAIQAAPAAQSPPENLPEGRGREILEASCSDCHGLEEVVNLRGKLTRDEWRAVVKTMTEYGALVEAKDVDVLVEYLDRHLGKRP